MIHLTLRHRLLLLTLLPSALIAIVLVGYFTYSGIQALEAELQVKGMATVRNLAPISEYGIIAGQVESLHGLVQAAASEPGVKAAAVVNQKGRTIAVSGRVSLAAEILREPLKAAGRVAETAHWVGFGAPVFRSTSDVDVLFEPDTAKAPGPEIIGHVFVELDKTALLNQRDQLLQRGLIIILAGLLLLAALAIAMADNLALPLTRLARAVDRMSSGDLDTRVAVSTSGEIGVLERGFNDMAAHIQEAHRSMQARIEEATQLLAHQARHDALTGLINRREFEHRLENALAEVQAGGDEFSVLFIDLDRFKHVSDTGGYLAGDELLRQMAQLFASRLRVEDVLARLGGDEFSIILSRSSASRASQVANDICAQVAAHRFLWQDKIFAIGASIGVTRVTRAVRSISEIIAAGDAACHRAKEGGRNRVLEQVVGVAEATRPASGHWAAYIATALAEDRLEIEAIPLLALQQDAASLCVELTARLSVPGRPAISLSALIDAAERYDQAPAVDQRLIDAAISALDRSRQRPRPMLCFVPLSKSSVASPETIDYIARRLASSNLSGNRLCLVYSEDVLTHMASQAMAFSRQLRMLGCQIALSEFGGGLSSFGQLRHLAPSYIKLNHSLTRDIGGDRAAMALLRAVREISADLHILLIADEMADQESIDQVRALGIDYAQGSAVAAREPFEVWLEGAVMR